MIYLSLLESLAQNIFVHSLSFRIRYTLIKARLLLKNDAWLHYVWQHFFWLFFVNGLLLFYLSLHLFYLFLHLFFFCLYSLLLRFLFSLLIALFGELIVLSPNLTVLRAQLFLLRAQLFLLRAQLFLLRAQLLLKLLWLYEVQLMCLICCLIKQLPLMLLKFNELGSLFIHLFGSLPLFLFNWPYQLLIFTFQCVKLGFQSLLFFVKFFLLLIFISL